MSRLFVPMDRVDADLIDVEIGRACDHLSRIAALYRAGQPDLALAELKVIQQQLDLLIDPIEKLKATLAG